MGGRLEVWGGRIGEHDQLIRLLARQSKVQADSFLAILSNFTRLGEQTEALGRFVAKGAAIDYPEGITDKLPAAVALDVLVQSLAGPRHLMTREEVAFFRGQIRQFLALQTRNANQVAKLAKVIAENRRSLARVERFYTMSAKAAPAKAKSRARKPRKR